MNSFDLMQASLMSPMVLAFVLGAVAVWTRSDLSFPQGLYTGLSIYLLLAIGLKGGHELAVAPLGKVVWPALATLGLGLLIPVIAFSLARFAGKFSIADAAALAAHYGSVSAVTFAASLTFLEARGQSYEGFLPAMVAILEIPAIVVALLIARACDPALKGRGWGPALHEVLTGRSVVLLLGGLAVGYFSTAKNFERVTPVFVNLFYGALVLFLLDMGMVAAKRLRDAVQAGPFLIAFSVGLPLVSGSLGVLAGSWSGLSVGGTAVLGVMAASASYIAAPAAVRVALPQANPGYYLTAAIGLTFPFNLTVGIPLMYGLSTWVHRV